MSTQMISKLALATASMMVENCFVIEVHASGVDRISNPEVLPIHCSKVMRQIPSLSKGKGNLFLLPRVSGRLQRFGFKFLDYGFADLADDVANSSVATLPGIGDLAACTTGGQIPTSFAQLQS